MRMTFYKYYIHGKPKTVISFLSSHCSASVIEVCVGGFYIAEHYLISGQLRIIYIT
ncbi:hypothetical protein BKA69DRAFT_1063470 [Paraphysoderma sedebokerense]|nr:hypothetical protein BKA69DRAFT_1063470 [Paraphysoderma sedebokerense]